MKPNIPQKLYDAYGLDVARTLPVQSGYRNHNYPAELADGTMVNLIVYKREPGMLTTLENSHRVAGCLYAKGFPARHQLDSRILQLRPGEGAQYAALYEFLPGETIPWEAYTREHIKNLGAAMSNMHALLAGQPQERLQLATQTLNELCMRMEEYFAGGGVTKAMKQKLGVVPNKVRWRLFGTVLPQIEKAVSQPLHLDFVRGNILFEPGSSKVVGVLDFEKASYGSPLIDVARTLAFLLVDCKYKQPDKVRKYFLRSGYVKRGSAALPRLNVLVNGSEYDALEVLVDMFLLYDFYKFLRHNPYESLAENEHYRRTCALLLERRGLLRVGPTVM